MNPFDVAVQELRRLAQSELGGEDFQATLTVTSEGDWNLQVLHREGGIRVGIFVLAGQCVRPRRFLKEV